MSKAAGVSQFITSAKITQEDADAIRAEYEASDVTQAELADEYGITQATISRLLQGKTWNHEDDE